MQECIIASHSIPWLQLKAVHDEIYQKTLILAHSAQNLVIRELHAEGCICALALFPAQDFLNDGRLNLGLDAWVKRLWIRDGHWHPTWRVQIKVRLVIIVLQNIVPGEFATV